MSLLLNMLSRLVHNFPSKEYASFNFMAAITICSDLEPQKIKPATVPIVSPSICHELSGNSKFSFSCLSLQLRFRDVIQSPQLHAPMLVFESYVNNTKTSDCIRSILQRVISVMSYTMYPKIVPWTNVDGFCIVYCGSRDQEGTMKCIPDKFFSVIWSNVLG